MAEQYRWFVGIDWATENHEICVLDAGGHTIGRRTVEHTGVGIAELVGYLQELAAGEPWGLAVSAETPRGAIIESLIEHQFHVYSLNRNTWIGFATGTRLPAPRTIVGMPW